MRGKLGYILLFSGLLVLNVAPASAQLQEGMPAPAVRVVTLAGETFDSAKQRGKVIVLNFWATWCKPCREEMPALDAFYRAHRAEGLEVIAVSVDMPRDLAKVKSTMRDFSFRAALASDGQTEDFGRLWRVPITFVIDRRGVLRFDGFKFAKIMDVPTLEKIVTPLLRESRGTVLADPDVTQDFQIAQLGE
jgi:cytochrome c biogenesis protein CcmG/thiol:disulfide interchange protein DsbE